MWWFNQHVPAPRSWSAKGGRFDNLMSKLSVCKDHLTKHSDVVHCCASLFPHFSSALDRIDLLQPAQYPSHQAQEPVPRPVLAGFFNRSLKSISWATWDIMATLLGTNVRYPHLRVARFESFFGFFCQKISVKGWGTHDMSSKVPWRHAYFPR